MPVLFDHFDHSRHRRIRDLFVSHRRRNSVSPKSIRIPSKPILDLGSRIVTHRDRLIKPSEHHFIIITSVFISIIHNNLSICSGRHIKERPTRSTRLSIARIRRGGLGWRSERLYQNFTLNSSCRFEAETTMNPSHPHALSFAYYRWYDSGKERLFQDHVVSLSYRSALSHADA